MAQRDKQIEKMESNPHNWKIEAVKSVAKSFGLDFREGKGSHVVFFHPDEPDNLSIPTKRPIKPIYIRQFVALIKRIKS